MTGHTGLVAPLQTTANQQLPPGDRSQLRPVIDFRPWTPSTSYSLKISHHSDSTLLR